MFFFKLYTNSRSFWAFGYIHSNYNFLHYPNVNKNKFLQLNVIIWTFWAVWICTKITYACAKKYLVCYNVLLLKVFCLKQPQKTETFLGNNNRMEWDDNRVRVSPQRETFDSHNLQNLSFFSLKRSYSSLCDKPYEGRNVKNGHGVYGLPLIVQGKLKQSPNLSPKLTRRPLSQLTHTDAHRENFGADLLFVLLDKVSWRCRSEKWITGQLHCRKVWLSITNSPYVLIIKLIIKYSKAGGNNWVAECMVLPINNLVCLSKLREIQHTRFLLSTERLLN